MAPETARRCSACSDPALRRIERYMRRFIHRSMVLSEKSDNISGPCSEKREGQGLSPGRAVRHCSLQPFRRPQDMVFSLGYCVAKVRKCINISIASAPRIRTKSLIPFRPHEQVLTLMLKRLRTRILVAATLALSAFVTIPHALATDAAWARLARGGYAILIQGADSSGTLSPTVDNSIDCSATQTLSDRGRQLAQKLGARFAARGVRIDKVLTSSTCNARETARLSFGSIPTEIFKPLDPMPGDDAAKQSQFEQIRSVISAFKSSGNLVMMTDRANITALTGIAPRPTEAVVVAPAEEGETIHIAGRIIFD
jgi:hypothetical protein